MSAEEQRPEEEAAGEAAQIDVEQPPAPNAAAEGPGSFGFEGDRPAFPADEEEAPAFPVEEVPDAYAQRPELYAGGAFVGGLLLAKLIGRFGRG